MRVAEGNRPRQRSRRSWRIRHAVEQAGTMGKRRAVPGHDRPPLGPVIGSGSKIAALKCAIFGLNSRQDMRALVTIAITVHSIDPQGQLKIERADGKILLFDVSTGNTI